MKKYVAVIGGGAAGAACAITAARAIGGENVVIIEKESRILKKLLATGNGKCNYTNTNMSADFYTGALSRQMDLVLGKITPKRLMDFFMYIGCLSKAFADGRVYPLSMQASAVSDLLRTELDALGVKTLCGAAISHIAKEKDGFIIHLPDIEVKAEKLCFATGGKSSKSLGSDGSGFGLLGALGEQCTKLYPGLAPVKCGEQILKSLKGVRSDAFVSLFSDGSLVGQERGEVQFTERALSGICVFNISHFVNEFFICKTVDGRKSESIYISLDLLPDYSLNELKKLLTDRKSNMPGLSGELFLTGIINKTLARTVASQCGSDIALMAERVKDMRFTPCGMSDFNQSQVTCGGIASVDLNTMESKSIKNVYIVGEALDVAGLCGGYNLHLAFASGIIAGEAL